jgi:hypothetical protein
VKHDTKKLNGHSQYANGSPVDAKLIGTSNGSGQTIEAEILGPDERFETTRHEPRDKARSDEDTPPTTRTLPKDRQH